MTLSRKSKLLLVVAVLTATVVLLTWWEIASTSPRRPLSGCIEGCSQAHQSKSYTEEITTIFIGTTPK